MAENLELSAREFDEDQFGHACNANASRSGTLRYRDTSDILDMVKARRRLSGREARLAAVQILAARKRAKALWLQDLLDRAAAGDFRAAGYFRRRRRSSRSELHGYAMRAGGFHKAVSELRHFYTRKFAADDLHTSSGVMAMYLARAGPVPATCLFTDEEVEAAVYGMRRGKSAGPDGVVYEHLHVMMSSELKLHFVEFLNRILTGELDLPAKWYTSRVAFLAKVRKPSQHLRPIVLSPATAPAHEATLPPNGLWPNPRGSRWASPPGRLFSCSTRHPLG